jgi:acyl-CoA synthetase (AMP-forming)/AMP-acid ligase II
MLAANLIRKGVKEFPDNIAVIFEDQKITFKEVYENSNKLANVLRGLGLEKGDKVAFLLSNSQQSVEIDLALLLAGLVRVPLNTRLSEEEHRHMINETEAKALLFTEELIERVIQLKTKTPIVSFYCRMNGLSNEENIINIAEELESASSEEVVVGLSEDDLATIQYTSGTTGVLKAAMHTQGTWSNICMNIKNSIDIRENDIMLHAAPLTHASGTLVLPHWISGAANAIVSSFVPQHFLETIEKHQVTTLNLVPTMITMLLLNPNVEKYSLSSIRQIIYGASPMPKEILQKGLNLWGPIFIQYYGQTESPLFITLLPAKDHLKKDSESNDVLLSCGKAISSASIKIVDPDLNELPPNTIGEIAVKSNQNMIGFYNETELTKATIVDGWIHTRDMGYLNVEGYLFLVDRKSDMIITGGFNVYPKEIEDVLYGHPAIAEAAVVGIPDILWGEAVKAFVVVKDGYILTEEEIIDYCKSKLASYKKPKSVEFMGELPKSAVGKIVRRVLREPYWNEVERQI